MKSKITVTIESDKPIDVVNKEEGGVTINPMTPDVEQPFVLTCLGSLQNVASHRHQHYRE
jgi:hypothetical protein